MGMADDACNLGSAAAAQAAITSAVGPYQYTNTLHVRDSRERESNRVRERQRERERERESVCVCVCDRDRARQKGKGRVIA